MPTIELYSGDSKNLEPSEEVVLEYLLKWLNEGGISAVIFTNFCLDSTQIDILLGMEGKTFQLEVKGHRGIITGQQNGDWTRIDKNNVTTSQPNGYRQALTANQVLRDHMRRIVGQDEKVAYPNGIVVFEGNIAHKSKIYGDKRVRICDLDKLSEMLSMPISNHGSWPLAWMRIFAQKKGLIVCPLPWEADKSPDAKTLSEPVQALPEFVPRSTQVQRGEVIMIGPAISQPVAPTAHETSALRYRSPLNHGRSSTFSPPPKRRRRIRQAAIVGLLLLAVAATLYRTPAKTAEPLTATPSPTSIKSAPQQTTDRPVARAERKPPATDRPAGSNTSEREPRAQIATLPILPAAPINCPAGVDRLGCNGKVGVLPAPECPAGFHVSGDTCVWQQR